MKIKPKHYAHMLDQISLAADKLQSKNAYLAAGLSEKRYRWDLSYAALLTPWICDNVYPYADDTHIDTALRRIVKELDL